MTVSTDRHAPILGMVTLHLRGKLIATIREIPFGTGIFRTNLRQAPVISSGLRQARLDVDECLDRRRPSGRCKSSDQCGIYRADLGCGYRLDLI